MSHDPVLTFKDLRFQAFRGKHPSQAAFVAAQRARYEHVNYDAPHIDEEIADVRITAKRPNDRRKSAKSDCRRQKLIGNTKENLTEIGEMLISGIVLKIGVGHERYDAVKYRRRSQHPSVQIIQWQFRPALKP